MSSSRMMRYSSPFDLDLGAGVLAEQDLVADLDVERDDLAVVVDLALADRDDLALLRLFLRGVGDDDAALGLLFLRDPLHDDAILQWPNLHSLPSPPFGSVL